MAKTEKNLSDAFAGESQANRKYLAFAIKAESEGHPQVARLFRAAARAETVHAHSHLRVRGGIKGTAENLQEAIEGETHEFESMYPRMIREAEAEGKGAARKSFEFANEVEKIHAALYRKVLENLGKNAATEYYVCKVCGNTVGDEPPEKCPICGAAGKAFEKVD